MTTDVEEVADVEDCGVHDTRADLLVAGDPAPPAPHGVRGEEPLDVAPVQLPQRSHLGMLLAEVLTEHRQGVTQAGQRGGP